jgi:hypothetical protein
MLCALVLVGCAGSAPRGRVPASAARSDGAVVYLSTECSGVLVTPRAVLTAAHCVEDPGPHRVLVDVRGERRRQRVPVVGCAVHPEAYDAPRPCGAGPGRTGPDHDLAVLWLARAPAGVRPLSVLLARPFHRARWWSERRVRLVGWDRRPSVVGPLARRSGPNRIVALEMAGFVTAPLSRGGFATRVGDSGGPALLDFDGDERVLGILWGGPEPGARASVYAPTYTPENSRWLVSTLGLGRDLEHLDPEDPWDRADWTELAEALMGLEGSAGVTAEHPPR